MYTYAFFKTPGAALQLQDGIIGEVQVIGTPVISALVEPEVNIDAIQQDDNQLVQAVLTHDRVICDLFWQTTILPLRFGTQFVSEEKLRDHLEANQANYLEKLNQLEGKAEYRLQLMPTEIAEPDSPDSLESDLKGRAYFLAKKQRFQEQHNQQMQQQAELQKVLAAIAQSYPNYIRREPNQGVEKLYLLVDRQLEMSLYEQLHDWQAECPSWELDLGEALPPYHFV